MFFPKILWDFIYKEVYKYNRIFHSITITIIIIIKYKGKLHAIAFLESVKVLLIYGCTKSLTSALDAGGWLTPRSGRFTLWYDPLPIVQETGWAPGLVWTG